MIEVGPALPREARAELRRRAIFDYHKHDPQFGDVDVLAPFVLRIAPSTYAELARLAEALCAELLAAETALVATSRHASLLAELDLPRAVRAVLAARALGPLSPPLCRVTRFDFHVTDEGLRISEANTDVPGGFLEGSALPRLMLPHHPGLLAPPDPGEAIASAIARGLANIPAAGGPPRRVGLVHATAYADDRQAMAFLADRLAERGIEAKACGPHELSFHEGRASLRGVPLAGLSRFFPAEWLPNLLLGGGWWRHFRGSRTPMSNPAVALVSQSKRLPLVAERLGVPMPTWKALLPETRDVRDARVDLRSGQWVLKPALGRVGEDVGLPGATPAPVWAKLVRAARRRPSAWIAQRVFRTREVVTPEGERYPCLGVFVVDGRAAGIYGRLGGGPVVDGSAHEAAVLIDARAERASGGSHGERA